MPRGKPKKMRNSDGESKVPRKSYSKNGKPIGRGNILSAQREEQLLEYIRGGAFTYVACEAVGIDVRTFYRWLREGKDPESHWHRFYVEVMKARALARVEAEVEVHRAQPLAWLRYGPGRDRPGRPGWTETTHQTSVVQHQVSLVDIVKAAVVEKRRMALPEGEAPPGELVGEDPLALPVPMDEDLMA